MSWLSHFRRDQRGVVAIVAALSITALVGMAAMALDVGLAYSRHAALQKATDMAALSATYNLGGASASAAKALAGNGFPASSLVSVSTVTGVYTASTTLAPSARFVASTVSPNAVKVTAQATSPVLFGKIFTKNPTLSVQATAMATQVNLAGLTAGTTLATANTNASVLNGLFGGLLGTSVNLTAVSYQGLAAANVSALQFLSALATQAGLGAGATYGQLAKANVSMGQVINAELAALAASGTSTTAAVTALNGLLAASGTATFPLASLIDVTAWKNQQITTSPIASALQANVNVFTLLTDAAQIVSGGGKVITLTPTIALPATGTNVSIQLVIGAPAQSTPYFSFSPVGASVHTAQVRMLVTLSLLNVLGLASLNLPAYIEAASGTATITAIGCGANPKTDATVTVLGKTGLATAWVGTVSPGAMTNFATEPTVGIATLASVAGLPVITASAGPDTFLSGSASKIFTQAMISPPPTSQSYTSTNVSSLATGLGGTNLSITVLGALSVTLSKAAVLSALQPLLSGLDPVVATLLSSLGIQLGKMDVTVNGVRCGVPVLGQ